MPRIVPYTAETKPAVPDRPLRFFETGESPAAGVTQQATQLAIDWTRIAGAIKGTQQDLEFSQAKSQYDPGIDLIHQELAKRTDLREPGQYEQAFIEERAKLEKNIAATLKDPMVSRAFGTYVGLRTNADHVKARGIGFKLATGRTIAELDAAEDELALKAGEAQDAESMKEPMIEYGKLVQRAYGRGMLTDQERQKRESSFDLKFRIAHMDYTERTDPEGFIAARLRGDYKEVPAEIRMKYDDRARSRIKARDEATEAGMKKVTTEVENWWAERALHKTLTDAEIEEAIDRKNPFITPEKAEHYRKLRDGGKLENTPVQIIMSNYAGVGRSEGSIANAMKELNNLEETAGKTSKELLDAKRMLFQDQNAMRSEERALGAAERGAAAAKQAAENHRVSLIHEEQRRAIELYNSKIEAAPFLPFMKGQYENELFTDRASIRVRVGQGVSADQAVQEQYDIRAKKMEELGKRTKGSNVDDIRKKLEGVR